MSDKARAKILKMIEELERISLEDIRDSEVAQEIETAIDALRNAVEIEAN